jgi:guanylate kinase
LTRWWREPSAGRPGKLIVLAGPSGVGKGAIVAGCWPPCPTRAVHLGHHPGAAAPEDEGRHYYFVDRGTFDEMIEAGGFLEWADIFGERYGTPREPVDRALAEGRDVLVEIDVQGARQVKAAETGAFMVFITPPSLQELERRLRTRGSETDQQVRRRLAKASDELAAEPEFDVTVVNDDLEAAAREVVEIVDRLGGVPSTAVTRVSRSGSTVIEPKIDDLLARVDSKYTLVILAARRARQINGYYSQLGEGIGEFVPPMVDAGPNRKALSVALQELVEDKLNWERPAEGRRGPSK